MYRSFFPFPLLAVFSTVWGSGVFGQAVSEGEAEQALRRLLPEDNAIPGWVREGEAQMYTPENLYEYIDGKAEHFLSYAVRRVLSQTYASTATPEHKITLDLYDMTAAVNAFGVYSSERYPDSEFVAIGNEGMVADSSLEFWKQRYFVRVIGTVLNDELAEPVQAFGRRVADHLPGPSPEPPLLQCLPRLSYVRKSAQYIRENVLGQEFLKNGYVARYRMGDRESQLFLVDAETPQQAREAYHAYRKFMEENLEGEAAEFGLGEESIVASVQYYGRLVALRQGRYVAGMVDVGSDRAARSRLKTLLRRLQKFDAKREK